MQLQNIILFGFAFVNFPVVGAGPSFPYVLKDVTGLGPTEVDVMMRNTLLQGGVYQGRRPQLKEITMRVGLNPTYANYQTHASLRDELYGLLSPVLSDSVGVYLMGEGGEYLQILGYVKKIEPLFFTNDPEVQIVIQCDEPYFSEPAPVLATPVSKLTPAITNRGTAPTGFEMEIIFTANMNVWSITKLYEPVPTFIAFARDFIIGDKIKFNTHPGKRSATITRNNIVTPLLPFMTEGSEWPMLDRGPTPFYTNDDRFNWGLVQYTPRYWGI